MIKALKTITTRTLIILNIIAIMAMLFIGYSDRWDPVTHDLLCNFGMAFGPVLLVNLFFLILWIFINIKKIWIPFLGLILCYGPIRTYTPFNFGQTKPHGAIKVLSYNVFMFDALKIQKGEKNPIVNYIIKSKADIVCLQEADDYAVDSAAVRRIFRAHYKYVSRQVKKKPGADNIVLLTNYPIIWCDTIPYASTSNMSVAYMLDIKGTKTLLVNNHFQSYGLNPDDKANFKTLVKGDFLTSRAPKESSKLVNKLSTSASVRALQAEMVAKFVKKYMDKGVPVILCGDFNDNPISYSHYTINKVLNDCYKASGNGPGLSYNRSGMYFRIDHIFASKEFEPYGATVDRSISSSDHYPIYCWLKYRPNP